MIFRMDGISVHYAAEAEIKGYTLLAMVHDFWVLYAAFLQMKERWMSVMKEYHSCGGGYVLLHIHRI